jgi:hypothetical protein
MVDHQAAIDHCISGDVVPTSTKSNRQAMLARVRNGESHVSRINRLNNEERSPVDHPVEDAPSRIVAGVTFAKRLAPQPSDWSSCSICHCISIRVQDYAAD